MKQIVVAIEMGTLLQTFSYINENGEIEIQLELPVSNLPETIAYYAHEKNINNILIFGKSEYTNRIKDLVISKSQTEYGKANYIIDLKEI